MRLQNISPKTVWQLVILVFIAFIYLLWLLFQSITAPLVSVIMPVYNRAEFLDRSITSILNQRLSDFEFIIIDDGSTDNTPNILKKYAKQDNRIRILTNKKNKGISFSRNLGLANARGKYIAVMDSDDMSFPWRLSDTVNFLETHPNITSVSGNIVYNDFVVPQEKRSVSFLTSDRVYLNMLFANIYENTTSLTRRNYIKKHNIHYNEEYISAEDFDFWSQILLTGGKLAILNKELGVARFHRTNTDNYYKEMSQNAFFVQQRLWRSLGATKDIHPISFFDNCQDLTMLAREKLAEKINIRIFDTIYNQYCPKNLKASYALRMPRFNSWLEPESGNIYRLKQTGESVTLNKLSQNKIRISFNHSQKTMDFQKKDNAWEAIPIYPPIKLEHTFWKDDLLIYGDDTACRKNISDCAEIEHFQKHKKIILNWFSYDPETFIYNQTTQSYHLEQKP